MRTLADRKLGPVILVKAVVPKLCAAAPWGAPKYSTRPTNYDLSIQ
jgi:hypothetical protein